MWLAYVPAVIMAMGLVVCIRGVNMSASTRDGTIAHFEAVRATEAGSLLTLLSSPWVALSSIILT